MAAEAGRHGTLNAVDLLDGLDAQDWSAVTDAYGPADGVPALLRQLVDNDPSVRASGLHGLWGTVWHQGTVYDGTPLVVPFLVRLAVNPEGDDQTTARVALLLASIAAATSSVVPGTVNPVFPEWLREPGESAPSRDLIVECRRAVAAWGDLIARRIAVAGPATQACLVAVLAAAATDLSVDTRAALRALEGEAERRLASAARLTRLLIEDAVSEEELARAASVDGRTTERLMGISDWPLRLRAVECVRETAEHCFTASLTEPPTPGPTHSQTIWRRFVTRGARP